MNTNAFLIRQLAFGLQKRTIPLDVEHLKNPATELLELAPFGSEVVLLESLHEEGTFTTAFPPLTPVAKRIVEIDFAAAEDRLAQSYRILEPGSYHSPEE